MSGHSHCWIDSSATVRGARSIAKALLISLCVHAVLIALFWQAASNWRDVPQRDLRVELSPSVRATPLATPAPAPAPSATPLPTERKNTRHANPSAPAPVASEPAPAPASSTADQAAPASSESGASAESHAVAEVRQPQHGALPIDLRVLDWLAQYRSYPFAARRGHLEGTVQLRVTLLPDGRLIDARVEHSSGHAVLDQAALDLLAHAAPLPDDFGGARTASIELQLPIVYRLRASST